MSFLFPSEKPLLVCFECFGLVDEKGGVVVLFLLEILRVHVFLPV